jgi:hypothetical protein
MGGLFSPVLKKGGEHATRYVAKKVAPDHFGKELFGKRLGSSWFTDTLNVDEVYFEKISRDFGLGYHEARDEFWKKPEEYTAYYDDWDGMDPARREKIDLDSRRVAKSEDPRLSEAQAYSQFRPDSDTNNWPSSQEFLAQIDIQKLKPQTQEELDVLTELRLGGATFEELKHAMNTWRIRGGPGPR